MTHIFIDLDETLVHSRQARPFTQDLFAMAEALGNVDQRALRTKLDDLVEARLSEAEAGDLTLRMQAVRSLELEISEEFLLHGGWQRYTSDEHPLKDRLFRPRPLALEFVEALAAMGKVSLCTWASRPYAEQCLRYIGVLNLFDALYCRDDLSSVCTLSRSHDVLLIDDLPLEDMRVLAKLHFIGLDLCFDFESALQKQLPNDKLPDKLPDIDYALASRYHLQVPAYIGKPGDQVLRDLAEKVEAKLAEFE